VIKILVFFLSLTISVLGNASNLYGGYTETLHGKVVNISDGDSLKVLDSEDYLYKIRLLGIDAPERRPNQAFSKKSKNYLRDLVAGRQVTVKYKKKDRYNRILGKIILNGEDINLKMVEAGLAWHYKKYQYNQTVEDRRLYGIAENSAKKDRRGLWIDERPTQPWEHRRLSNKAKR
jgi:endonuclease YncB( thermonuclease family)